MLMHFVRVFSVNVHSYHENASNSLLVLKEGFGYSKSCSRGFPER